MKKNTKKYTITCYQESRNFGTPKDRDKETRSENHTYWGDFKEVPLSKEERYFLKMERKRLYW